MKWLTLVFFIPAMTLWAQVRLTPLVTMPEEFTAITNAGDSRLFVCAKRGKIYIVNDGALENDLFLDLSAIVSQGLSSFSERGLLSMAFHPDYAENGFFFVNYTNVSGDTVIARYEVSDDPDVADPTSAEILLTIAQPASNHNGGQLQFGPDGFLYIGMGDGGSAGDPWCNAQDLSTMQGKMLRIDVDQNVNTPPFYGIPVGNPFPGDDGIPDEIWALGLRNPWRFSFDGLTGDLYIADVGQNQWEEVNHVPAGTGAGSNFGWDVKEADACFEDDPGCPTGVPACLDAGLTDPVATYFHSGGRCSITGGYVYAAEMPTLTGKYFYADYCSNDIWTLHQSAPGVWETDLLDVEAVNPRTFGIGSGGEVYVDNGQVIHLISEVVAPSFLWVRWGDDHPIYGVINILDMIEATEPTR